MIMVEKAIVKGVELSYELTGSSGETLVFLNGIAMSIVHWKLFAEALPSYRRLAFDFRGQILSGRPDEKYTLAGQADDMAQLLERLGIGKVHIVGTSYGSAVGFFFALAHPDLVSSMVVIDGASEVDPLLRAAIEAWRAAALATPRAFYRSLIPWTYSASWIERNEAFLTEREAAIETFPKNYFTAFASLCDAFSELSITEELRRINCPTLVLEGEKGHTHARATGARSPTRYPAPGSRSCQARATPRSSRRPCRSSPRFSHS